MTRWITVEQAVEAVRLYFKDCAFLRQCPTADAVEFLLRALPPAEATEEEVERVAMAVAPLLFIRGTTGMDVARAAIAAMRGGR